MPRGYFVTRGAHFYRGAVPSRFSEIRVSKRGREDADCVNLSVAASAVDFIAPRAKSRCTPAVPPSSVEISAVQIFKAGPLAGIISHT